MSQSTRDDLRKQKERGDLIPKECRNCFTVHYPTAKVCHVCGGQLREVGRAKRQGGAK